MGRVLDLVGIAGNSVGFFMKIRQFRVEEVKV